LNKSGTKRVLYGGRFFSPENGGKYYDAMAISGDRIVAVGEYRQVKSCLTECDEQLDMEGTFVMPGFIDGHCHLVSLGNALRSVDLTGCRSIEEMKKRVAEKVAKEPAGSWILGRGWNQNLFSDRRYPRRDDLDEVAPESPVFLKRVCGHAAVANSLALKKSGINSGYEDSESGYLERDDDGRPAGVLHEVAMQEVSDAIPDPTKEEMKRDLKTAISHAHSQGITSVHTNDWERSLSDILSVYRKVCTESGLPLRAYLDVPRIYFDDLRGSGLITGSGNNWVRIGALKLFADGSLGARSAALSHPYCDDEDNRGVMVTPLEVLEDTIIEAHSEGMQVAIHAIGDRALDVSLDSLQQAYNNFPRVEPRHRMIHCQITRADQFSRLAELNCISAIQPVFVPTDMQIVEDRVGKRLASTSYAWRSMLEEGLICSGGSDAPVESINPIFGVWAAVCRTDWDGSPDGGWYPRQKLSPSTALSLFTRYAAFAEFSENIKGVLAPGALADFAVLDSDPNIISPGKIRDISVIETWVGGRTVFSER